MQERDFKGIWIPKEIYLNTEISWTEKILLLEIDSLSKLDKGCFASNQYFADFLNCKEQNISRSLSKLKKLGYIKQLSFDGRKRQLISTLNLKVCLSKNDEAENETKQKIQGRLSRNDKADSAFYTEENDSKVNPEQGCGDANNTVNNTDINILQCIAKQKNKNNNNPVKENPVDTSPSPQVPQNPPSPPIKPFEPIIGEFNNEYVERRESDIIFHNYTEEEKEKIFETGREVYEKLTDEGFDICNGQAVVDAVVLQFEKKAKKGKLKILKEDGMIPFHVFLSWLENYKPDICKKSKKKY